MALPYLGKCSASVGASSIRLLRIDSSECNIVFRILARNDCRKSEVMHRMPVDGNDHHPSARPISSAKVPGLTD